MDVEKYIMAIDQGTTSSRALMFNRLGEVVATSQKEITQHFPEPGWVEHDANEIWNSVQSVIAEVFIESGIKPETIQGIGITNQRETTVVWDKNTGLPVYHAVVWQSRQSAPIAEQLKEEGRSEFFHERTGLIIDSYFSATKIRWILDHIENGQQRAENGELLFGTIDTWLTWKLTGGEVHVTDVSNASRTMLFNIHTLQWDTEILSILNIPLSMLPTVCSNSEVYGETKEYHFYGSKVPISGMAGDQQAALFGQLALEDGMVKNTYGTGSFIVMNTGNKPRLSKNKLLTTIAYKIGNETNYALEGSIFVAGSSVQWLRDGLEIIKHAKETESLALLSQDEDEVYVVPAFVGLGAPYWDQNVRGAIFGLTRGTTKNDLVKGTLQGIAYQVKDILLAMEEDTGMKIPVLKVDGGAAKNNFLMQFQSDILGVEVQKAKNLETTALGVAFMAGLAVGFWKDLEEIKAIASSFDTFDVKMDEGKREKLYQGWQKAIQATKAFQ